MRRLKAKAARDHHDASSPAPSRSGSKPPCVELSSSLADVASGASAATVDEELVSQISSSALVRIPQLLAAAKERGSCAVECAAVRACLTERIWQCLQGGLASVGAAIIVNSQLWESLPMILACIDAVDARSSERARIADAFLCSPSFPERFLGDVFERVSPDFAIKSIRKRHVELRSFPLLYQHAVFKELTWICSQFEFNQVFGTLLISAIACYPELPVLAFAKERLPRFFDARKKAFLQNPSAHLLPSLPPPATAPSCYSVPSHVNVQCVSDASGLLQCIDMVRTNSIVGIDMEWSGAGVLSHAFGQPPADVIQIGNSPSSLLCSVFLLDTRAIRHEVSLIQTLFHELFSSTRTVLVCDFSADRLALSAAFPDVTFPDMAAPQLRDLSLTGGKVKKSLSSLAKEFCEINLSKSWQICGWNFRPWLPPQLEYAAADVLVLHMVHEKQQS